jgi:hypothetical protein
MLLMCAPLACWSCLYRQVLLPSAAGVAILAAGGGAGAIPLFLMAGLIGFVFYLYRQQLQLVGRLLAVSGHALMENPSIVGGSLLLQLAGMSAFCMAW